MTNIETTIVDYIKTKYPDAIIETFFWASGEMIFQPSPKSEKRASCVMKNGECFICWDF